MTSAKTGQGTLLCRDSTTYSYPVAEVRNISGPKCTSNEIDVTNHDSIGAYKEVIMGLLDGGEVTIEANFIPGDTNGQVALAEDYVSQTIRDWHIHLPAALSATWSFAGYVKSFSVDVPTGDAVKFTATIRVSGSTSLKTTLAGGLTTPFFALKDNSANAVTPSPAAANAVYSYWCTLDSGDTSIAVQPTAAAGSIYVEGVPVVSGAWSGAIAVASGGTKLIHVVVEETNKASRVYRIHVTRPSA